MKKFLKTILFLCALSSLAYAEDDGIDVLNRMRAKIEKEEEEKAKAQKLAEEQARKEAEAQAKTEAKAQEEQQKAIEEAKNTELVNVEEVTVVEETATMSAKDEKEAMNILDRMRAKIEKEEAEKAKLTKEAKELGVETSDITNVEEVQAMVEENKVKEVKPKTPAEKLEATRKKAMDKLDFYERVVRSVAREEAEIAGYYEIMGEEKARPSIMDGQTNPAEVPQEETQTSEAEGQ